MFSLAFHKHEILCRNTCYPLSFIVIPTKAIALQRRLVASYVNSPTPSCEKLFQRVCQRRVVAPDRHTTGRPAFRRSASSAYAPMLAPNRGRALACERLLPDD